MSDHATMQRALLVLLWLSCCSYALPRVIIRNHKRNPANVHVRYNTSDFNGLKPIDETSYIDFNSGPSITSKRPNVCDNCVCGVGRKTRIVGGNVTSVYEYPWIVSMSKQGTFYCAGSLITRRHVLTAAHCLGGFDKRSIKLILADNNRTKLDKNSIVRRIKSVVIHENFHASTYNNDIAIIEMDRPVDVNGVVRTACLPEDNKILSTGDSGGPLHVKGTFGHLEVIGIISWGRGCARPNFPGIYTKLTNYLGWLKDHLDDECVCPPPRRE
ncbi:plasma kallikrein-like [Ceratina calcarata]|uniref:Plasma kallikrein-like n=1 Tax=Ceratina calcarata TaxID=156304 RepID=A0AAJ7WCC2_9HYME|nr:plasma kallikrein-like [Ceratina calcarata]